MRRTDPAAVSLLGATARAARRGGSPAKARRAGRPGENHPNRRGYPHRASEAAHLAAQVARLCGSTRAVEVAALGAELDQAVRAGEAAQLRAALTRRPPARHRRPS